MKLQGLFTRLWDGKILTSRDVRYGPKRRCNGIKAVFKGQALADLISAAIAMDWNGPPTVPLLSRIICEDDKLYMFLRSQYLISRDFEKGRALLERLYAAAKDDGLDTSSEEFKARISVLPEYAKKSKKGFLLLPSVGFHSTFITITRLTMLLIFKLIYPYIGDDIYREHPLHHTSFWWQQMLVVDGMSFQSCQSRRQIRRKLRRLSGVMTSNEIWELYLSNGGDDKCPCLFRTFQLMDGHFNLVKKLAKKLMMMTMMTMMMLILIIGAVLFWSRRAISESIIRVPH